MTDSDDLNYDSDSAAINALLTRVPTTLSNEPRTPWKAESYAHAGITGSGAIKLASSGVAPLVAYARGFETIVDEAKKDFAKTHAHIGDGRSKTGSHFLSLFDNSDDVLYMPWNSVNSLKASAEYLSPDKSRFLQFRPENPELNAQGKPVKYVFLKGSDTPLDFHPSVTADWVAGASQWLIAEGMLKGDSALTAQLRRHYDDDELSIKDIDASRLAAMKRLAELMAGIPPHERTAILNIAGVGNWKNNPEWSAVMFKDKQVIVAFDGDVATNFDVWNLATQLFKQIERKHGEPVLLDLAGARGGEEALALDPKMGMDDYFQRVGDWDDLITSITESFPPAPDRKNSSKDGDWQVRNDETTVDKYVADKDDNGQPLGSGHWETQYNIGGRVTYFEVRRAATDLEIEGHPFGAGFKEAQHPSFVALELAWIDENTGDKHLAEVTGPAAILNYQPSEWMKQGASIPNDLLAHPEWPPQQGREWLSAIKKNEALARSTRTKWSTMGWVPAPDSRSQVFIIGDQVIAVNDEVREATLIGVDDSQLSGAGRFGLDDRYTGPGLTDPSGECHLEDDIRTMVDAWITRGPWLTSQVAATMLALAIRPTVPVPTSIAAYLTGPPQKGKSWSARQIMSWYQRYKNVWATLPGNADDTFAATENAVSRAPIWVADDLAPQGDKRRADMMESNIAAMIRAVHNKLGKRRMNSDMSSKAVLTPQALFIVTAENESSTQSIRERVVNVEFKGLHGENMKDAEAIAANETTASRITAAILRMFIQRGESEGWAALVDSLRFDRENAEMMAKSVLSGFAISSGDLTRPAGIIADLSLGLTALAQLCTQIGLDDIADKITWEQGGWLYAIAEQVSYAHRDKAEAAPGAVLLDSVRNLLASGAAHIQNIEDPSRPPITEGEDQKRENLMLGWRSDSQGDLRPQGVTVGYATKRKNRTTGEVSYVIFLSRDEAFNEAQKKYPKRIQYGASATTSWKDVWNLGLVHPFYLDKRPTKGVVVQFNAGKMRPYGIPVSLESLFPDVGNLAGEEDDE